MKSLLPDTLAGRTAALLFSMTLLLVSGSAILLYEERHEQFDRRDRSHLSDRIVTLVRLVSEADTSEQARIIKNVAKPGESISIDPTPLVKSQPMHPFEHNLARKLQRGLRLSDHKSILVRATIDHKQNRTHRPEIEGIVFSIRLSKQSWLNITTEKAKGPPPWQIRTLVFFTLLLVALSVGGYFLARRISQPMVQLGVAAERFGMGREQTPMAETGSREVRHTIRAFNQMQQRIHKQIEDRSLMLAAVSHDLRTPITTLRLRAEYIEDDEMRDRTLATLGEMEAILNATLDFARDEAADEKARDTDLDALLQTLVDDHSDLGHQVEFNSPGRLIYRCRPVALRRAINNLVDNAVQYGERTTITLGNTEDLVEIFIDDNGPGIPEEKLSEVFTPFFRLEDSRSRDTGGVGLGLAVARSIVLAHGGELTLTNKDEGGLRASLSLPQQNRA